MRTLTLLRLAGIGFFGVTFLSPRSLDERDWLIDELSSTKTLIDLPFTSSAFFQENNYPKKPEQTPALTSITAAPECNDTTGLVLRPIKPERTKEKYQREKTLTDNSQSNPAIVVSTESFVDSTEIYDTQDPLLYSHHEKEIIDSNSLITDDLLRSDIKEEEIIQPPSEFVDVATISKPVTHIQSMIPIISTSEEVGLASYSEDLMAMRIEKVSDMASNLGYSHKYAFLINLGLKSGKKRFFIIDLEKRSILSSGLVAHGRGKEKFTLAKKYSNTSGSSCSSLGLYKVGASYYGGFGKSFRLIGLEKTNNNALTRAIVLHSMGCIPDEEIDYPICQSEGCPSVSPSFLEEINAIIEQSQKPILLWMFDPAIDEKSLP